MERKRPDQPAYKAKLAEAERLRQEGEGEYLRIEEAVDDAVTGTDDYDTHQTVKALYCLDVIQHLLATVDDRDLCTAIRKCIREEL